MSVLGNNLAGLVSDLNVVTPSLPNLSKLPKIVCNPLEPLLQQSNSISTFTKPMSSNRVNSNRPDGNQLQSKKKVPRRATGSSVRLSNEEQTKQILQEKWLEAQKSKKQVNSEKQVVSDKQLVSTEKSIELSKAIPVITVAKYTIPSTMLQPHWKISYIIGLKGNPKCGCREIPSSNVHICNLITAVKNQSISSNLSIRKVINEDYSDCLVSNMFFCSQHAEWQIINKSQIRGAFKFNLSAEKLQTLSQDSVIIQGVTADHKMSNGFAKEVVEAFKLRDQLNEMKPGNVGEVAVITQPKSVSHVLCYARSNVQSTINVGEYKKCIAKGLFECVMMNVKTIIAPVIGCGVNKHLTHFTALEFVKLALESVDGGNSQLLIFGAGHNFVTQDSIQVRDAIIYPTRYPPIDIEQSFFNCYENVFHAGQACQSEFDEIKNNTSLRHESVDESNVMTNEPLSVGVESDEVVVDFASEVQSTTMTCDSDNKNVGEDRRNVMLRDVKEGVTKEEEIILTDGTLICDRYVEQSRLLMKMLTMLQLNFKDHGFAAFLCCAMPDVPACLDPHTIILTELLSEDDYVKISQSTCSDELVDIFARLKFDVINYGEAKKIFVCHDVHVIELARFNFLGTIIHDQLPDDALFSMGVEIPVIDSLMAACDLSCDAGFHTFCNMMTMHSFTLEKITNFFACIPHEDMVHFTMSLCFFESHAVHEMFSLASRAVYQLKEDVVKVDGASSMPNETNMSVNDDAPNSALTTSSPNLLSVQTSLDKYLVIIKSLEDKLDAMESVMRENESKQSKINDELKGKVQILEMSNSHLTERNVLLLRENEALSLKVKKLESELANLTPVEQPLCEPHLSAEFSSQTENVSMVDVSVATDSPIHTTATNVTHYHESGHMRHVINEYRNEFKEKIDNLCGNMTPSEFLFNHYVLHCFLNGIESLTTALNTQRVERIPPQSMISRNFNYFTSAPELGSHLTVCRNPMKHNLPDDIDRCTKESNI